MKIKLLIVLLIGLSFAGCSNPLNSPTPSTSATVQKTYLKPSPAKQKAYLKTRQLVGISTKNDSNYKSFRSDLDTEVKKELFNDLMYRLWDRQITRDQFIAQGVAAFPTHRYEFIYIANAFQRYS